MLSRESPISSVLNECWLFFGDLLQISYLPDNGAGLEPGCSNSKRSAFVNILYYSLRSVRKQKEHFFWGKSGPLTLILGLYMSVYSVNML